MNKLLATLLISLSLLVAPTPASAGPDPATQLLTLTNADRKANGLPPLRTAPGLDAFAQRKAATLAGSWTEPFVESLHTTPAQFRTAFPTGWKVLGENLGQGPDLVVMEQKFMASPTHRHNIVDPRFTEVGIGVAGPAPDGRFYVAVEFREQETTTTTTSGAHPATAPAARTARAVLLSTCGNDRALFVLDRPCLFS